MRTFTKDETKQIKQAKQAWYEAQNSVNVQGKHAWYEAVKIAKDAYLALLNKLSNNDTESK